MARLRVLGTTWCPDCTRTRALLDAHHVDYEWTDIEIDDVAAQEVEGWHNGNRVVPTVLFDDGSMMSEPSDEELAAKLGLR
ncbi:MAG: glutaredoxin family protein [Acidimicrobiales bacterium]